MQAIVVATTPDGGDKLANFMRSLSGYDKYQIVILSDYSFEVGKIKFVVQHTDIDEFLFLHDSCEIKDLSLFDKVFYSKRSVALSMQPAPFGMYLGKYQRKVLEKMNIPEAKTKLDSVNFEETFNTDYAIKTGGFDVLSPPLANQQVFVQMFGRTNMKLENDYLIKYKATWNRSQLS